MNLKLLIVLSFFLGFGSCFLVLVYPLMAIGLVAITGLVLFAFRDNIDFGEMFKGNVKQTIKRTEKTQKKQLKKCEECGSTTKHKIWCSHYGESKRFKVEKPLTRSEALKLLEDKGFKFQEEKKE